MEPGAGRAPSVLPRRAALRSAAALGALARASVDIRLELPHALAAPPLQGTPPSPLLADHSTLSILRGDGQYAQAARGPVVAAVDGQDVAVGDRLISGGDASLLLTFFEGSTFTVTPGTDIVVERLNGGQSGGAVQRDFSLQLNAGTIWARVVSLGAAAPFQVKTTNAVAVVRGSQIGARVLPDGTFQCWTREGVMGVDTAAGQQADVQPGDTLLVGPDGRIAVTRPFSPAQSLVRFAVHGGAWPLIVHPDGGANGYVAPGVVVSQTFGAFVAPPAPPSQPQTFEVPASVSGVYTLVLTGRSDGGATGGSYGVQVTGLLSELYAGTPDPEERLLTGAEIVGEIGAGEVLAVDLQVDVERSGQPDALLRSISVSPAYPTLPPYGPARVRVSPVEVARLGLS